MEIILRSPKNKYSEIFSFKELDNFDENFKKISLIKGAAEVKIFAINESINCDQLSKIKNKSKSMPVGLGGFGLLGGIWGGPSAI